MAMIRKKNMHTFIYTTNIITIILCVVSIGLLIATCLNSYFSNKQQIKNIKNLNSIILKLSNDKNYTTDKELEDIYLSYYNAIDQKATDSINIALSFFGFIFSLTTIVNTIISVRMPRQFENNLIEIDNRINDIERSAKQATNAARFVDEVTSRKTTKEKIDAITSIIENYGDNSGEFYFARGFLYDEIKDFDKAKRDYIQAKKAGGDKYVYHNSMGVLYSNIMNSCTSINEKTRAFKKSENHYKKAIKLLEELDKNGDYCHCNLASLYQDYSKVLKEWSKVEKNTSTEPYSEDYRKYNKLALYEFEQAISISDDYLLAYYNRGISYREMGEKYYKNAYDDFKKCYELDSDNEDVLELLSDTALSLFQETNDEEFFNVAKSNIRKLSESTNKFELLQKRFQAIESQKSKNNYIAVSEYLANADEKFGNLKVEEAEECKDSFVEYGNNISEALKHFKSSQNVYRKLYSETHKSEYLSAIERLQKKINEIESSEYSPNGNKQ